MLEEVKEFLRGLSSSLLLAKIYVLYMSLYLRREAYGYNQTVRDRRSAENSEKSA